MAEPNHDIADAALARRRPSPQVDLQKAGPHSEPKNAGAGSTPSPESGRTDADAPHRGDASSSPRWFERIPLPVRGALYYVAFLAFILILVPGSVHVLSTRFLPWRIELGWGRIVGWLVFLVFYVIYTLSSVLLMRHGRGTYVEFDPPSRFVATGPFRWCRNPIAACLLGMILGEALAFSSTGILLLFVIGLPLAHLQVVLLEEPLLEKRFGQTYRDYRARVPRWIPRPPGRDTP